MMHEAGKGRRPAADTRRDLVDYLIYLTIIAIFIVLILQLLAMWRGVRGPVAFLNPPFNGREEFSILMVGVDGGEGRQRTDTIMLARINVKARTVRVLSIPRDSRVEIPGYGKDKINAAFVHGGINLTRDTIRQIIGIPADYYLTVDFNGFKAFVDDIGGVEIDVDKRMRYRDRSQDLDINLRPGLQRLNGEQAMGYVRYRHDVMGDITRIGRQQKFIQAVSRQFLSAYNIARLPSLLERLRDHVDTDMPARDLLALAKTFKKSEGVSFKAATMPGQPETIRGISYWVLDPQEVYLAVHELFFSEEEGAAGAGGAGGELEVLNGSGISGMADQAAGALEGAGFKVGRTGNADRFDYKKSCITAGRSVSGEAKRVAGILKIRDLQIEKDKEGITVIVGCDYCP